MKISCFVAFGSAKKQNAVVTPGLMLGKVTGTWSVLSADRNQSRAFGRQDRGRRLALHWCVPSLRLMP